MDLNELKYFEHENFYDFYKSITDPKIKKLLRSHIAKYCRVDGKTVRNWVSQKSVPFTQSNRVTEAVKLTAIHLDMDPHNITEKMLFPNFALEIETYAV